MQNDRRAATYLLITAALWYLRSTITQSVRVRVRVIVAIRVDGAELELELNIVGNGISKVVIRRREGRKVSLTYNVGCCIRLFRTVSHCVYYVPDISLRQDDCYSRKKNFLKKYNHINIVRYDEGWTEREKERAKIQIITFLRAPTIE